jgi:uncharacterized protein (TIGR02265 family)
MICQRRRPPHRHRTLVNTPHARDASDPTFLAFVDPSSLPPIDVDEAIRAIPPDATIKGMFIQGLLDLVPAAQSSDARRRVAFKDYPLAEFAQAAVMVARIVHPDLDLRAALREVGRSTYRAFLQSLTGRVLFGVLGKDLQAMIAATTKAYGLTQSHGRAVVVEKSTHHCVLRYDRLYQFLDALEVGVVEEAVTSCGYTAEIALQLESSHSGTMLVRFRPLAT